MNLYVNRVKQAFMNKERARETRRNLSRCLLLLAMVFALLGLFEHYDQAERVRIEIQADQVRQLQEIASQYIDRVNEK